VSEAQAATESIATARLDLMPLTRADAAEMVTVLSGEALYAFTGGSPPTFDELRNRYTRQVVGRSADGLEAWHNWVVRTRPDRAAIGYVQATVIDRRRAEVAWVIGLAWQRRGYATEAAMALVAWLEARGIGLISANIHVANTASASVARRVGLEPTARFVDGEQVWERAANGRSR
jgi:RimJ/RimL family protein N-acetyltransferase